MNQDDLYNLVSYSAGDCSTAILTEISQWQKDNNTKRLWAQDATLWTNSDESKWMGWLDIASEQKEILRVKALAHDLITEEFTDILLMGMGGSSLCPAMMAATFGNIKNFPRLHILDSTDPLQIRHLEERLNLKKTFFIVSSKSGSTLEPNIFKDYFFKRVQTVLNKTDVGHCFMAITDPGSSLETVAKAEHFKAIFYGITSIGGRYSALSNFGMVPSGLMGVDIKEFLSHAEEMRQHCLPSVAVEKNPGVVLGIILGVCAKQGKDKVTLIVSPEIYTLGAWLEQLLAESTGKEGKGLIPVDQEALGKPAVYDKDRVFVYVRLECAPDAKQDEAMNKLEQAGAVVVRLRIADKMHLGAELFRWEIATDVAGSILGIDPFNQPDVEESKILTQQLTDDYENSGRLTSPAPFFSADGLSLFADETNRIDIENNLVLKPSMVGYLQAHFNRIKINDYVNLSAFIEMSNQHTLLIQESRRLIRDHKKVATCLGFGPRFLHSTGQAYKGGPDTGVFLQITADHSKDLPIPDHRYTFGVVITAQAQADFAVLCERKRRALRIHLGQDVPQGLKQLQKFITQALTAELKNG